MINSQTENLIYTDGACQGNPGPGGWGFLILPIEGEIIENSGAVLQTTNNRMELTAVIEALKAFPHYKNPVVIYSDSKYVIDGISVWIDNWIRHNWKRGKSKPVLNVDLWKELFKLKSRYIDIRFEWVQGHAGNGMNERVDELATNAIKKLI